MCLAQHPPTNCLSSGSVSSLRKVGPVKDPFLNECYHQWNEQSWERCNIHHSRNGAGQSKMKSPKEAEMVHLVRSGQTGTSFSCARCKNSPVQISCPCIDCILGHVFTFVPLHMHCDQSLWVSTVQMRRPAGFDGLWVVRQSHHHIKDVPLLSRFEPSQSSSGLGKLNTYHHVSFSTGRT